MDRRPFKFNFVNERDQYPDHTGNDQRQSIESSYRDHKCRNECLDNDNQSYHRKSISCSENSGYYSPKSPRKCLSHSDSLGDSNISASALRKEFADKERAFELEMTQRRLRITELKLAISETKHHIAEMLSGNEGEGHLSNKTDLEEHFHTLLPKGNIEKSKEEMEKEKETEKQKETEKEKEKEKGKEKERGKEKEKKKKKEKEKKNRKEMGRKKNKKNEEEWEGRRRRRMRKREKGQSRKKEKDWDEDKSRSPIILEYNREPQWAQNSDVASH